MAPVRPYQNAHPRWTIFLQNIIATTRDLLSSHKNISDHITQLIPRAPLDLGNMQTIAPNYFHISIHISQSLNLTCGTPSNRKSKLTQTHRPCHGTIACHVPPHLLIKPFLQTALSRPPHRAQSASITARQRSSYICTVWKTRHTHQLSHKQSISGRITKYYRSHRTRHDRISSLSDC